MAAVPGGATVVASRVTIHERLIEIGADDSEAREAESLLARFVV